jgi:hypothetical protein
MACANTHRAHNRAMAHRRRSSRGRGPRGGALDVQGTLGTLLRTTLHQVGVVREVVERQARSSLANLDQVMLQRKRRDTLARLGELVYDMARDHGLASLAGHTQVAELIAEVDEIDLRLEERPDVGPGTRPGRGAGEDDWETGRPPDYEAVSSADWRPPERGRSADRRAGQRVWRPVMPPEDASAEEPPARAHAARAGDQRGARGSADDRPDGSPEHSRDAPAAAPARPRRRRARHRAPSGGIAFMVDAAPDEDDDLSEYMHEDDVPRRD